MGAHGKASGTGGPPGRATHGRREFLKAATAVSAAAGMHLACSPAARTTPAQGKGAAMSEAAVGAARPEGPLVGIHIAPHSFYDEGLAYCLDLLGEAAGVNALLVSAYSYYGAMGRPRHLMGDHGVPLRDNTARRLPKVWVRHHADAFPDTPLRHVAPDPSCELADRDVLAELAEPARRRGMKLYLRMYEPSGQGVAKHILGWDQVQSVDAYGQAAWRPCWNHPAYRGFLADTLKDLFRTYPLDGLQYGAERVGWLSLVLSGHAAPACFCPHCLARAGRASLDADRARQGYMALHEAVREMVAGKARPPDGAFTSLVRVLLAYPEVLAWDREFLAAGEEIHGLVRDAVKEVRPTARVGRHVDHAQSSWDLLYRAAVPYATMARTADFIKMILYHEILGPRLRGWVIDRWHRTVAADLAPEQALDLYYALMGHDRRAEPTWDELAAKGLSPEYVYRETKRAVDGVAGRAAVYAGIGLDIPKGGGWGTEPWPSDPERLYGAARRAFDAGAAGIVISREYEENRLDSLTVVGRAVRDAAAGRRPPAPGGG